MEIFLCFFTCICVMCMLIAHVFGCRGVLYMDQNFPSRSQWERERILFIDFKFYFSYNFFISFFLRRNSWDAILEIHIFYHWYGMEYGVWMPSNSVNFKLLNNNNMRQHLYSPSKSNALLRELRTLVCDEKNVGKIFKYSIFGKNSFLKASFMEFKNPSSHSIPHMNMLNILQTLSSISCNYAIIRSECEYWKCTI